MNPKRIPMVQHDDHNADDIAELREDQREIFDRLRKLEQWQSFVLGATAAFWVFVSFVAWWLGSK